MFRLNANDHGLVDPRPTATICLCALSAVLLLLFFILTGYNHGGGTVREVFFLADQSIVHSAAASPAVSLGLIASVVRYRHPIASTFAVVTPAPFLGLGLLFSIGPVTKAFAGGGPEFGRAMTLLVLQLFTVFSIFSIAFSSDRRRKPGGLLPDYPQRKSGGNSRAGDPCACPDDLMSNGHRCGGNSAHDRSDGASPLCYASEVTPDMIARYRARRSNH